MYVYGGQHINEHLCDLTRSTNKRTRVWFNLFDLSAHKITAPLRVGVGRAGVAVNQLRIIVQLFSIIG